MKRLFFAIAIILIGLTAFTADPPGTKVPIGLVVGAGKTKTVIDSTELKRIKDIDDKVDASTITSSLDEFYNKTQSNARFINEDGDTITGIINIPTAAAGTNTTQAASTAFVNSMAENGSVIINFANNNGSNVLGITVGISGISTTSLTMSSQRLYLTPVRIDKSGTIHGIKFIMSTAGDYTASNFNGAALFTESGGTYSQVMISDNSPDIWKTSNSTQATLAFNTTRSVVIGEIYYVGIIYSSSAQVTAPSFACGVSWTNASININTLMGFTESRKYNQYLSSQSTMPNSVTASATTTSNTVPFILIY